MSKKTARDVPSWSVSRSALLGSCKRAVFIELTTESKDRDSGHEVPLRTVVGSAVHQAIATQMQRWRTGEPVSSDEAEDFANNFVSTLWRAKETRITEALNGMELVDSVYHEMQAAAHHQLRNFFKMIWPQYSAHSYVAHEYRDSFIVNRAKVWVQVDLATRDGEGTLVISDWKTGWLRHAESEAFQMAVYALWANQRYSLPLDCIRTQVVNLRTGQVVNGTPSDVLLSDTRARIEAEASELKRLDEPLRFPASPESQKC